MYSNRIFIQSLTLTIYHYSSKQIHFMLLTFIIRFEYETIWCNKTFDLHDILICCTLEQKEKPAFIIY